MRKFCAGLVTAVLAAMFLAPSVATAADAYPDPTVDIIIDPNVCVGEPLPFTGSSTVTGTWTVTYLGQTKTGSGKNFAVDFSTKNATAGKSVTLTAIQKYDGGTLKRTANINLPACDDEAAAGAGRGDGNGSGISGLLPNTGGISFWIIVLGAALVVAGGATFVRRRNHA